MRDEGIKRDVEGDIPGSRRVRQSRFTILAQSSAFSMSVTKVEGV